MMKVGKRISFSSTPHSDKISEKYGEGMIHKSA